MKKILFSLWLLHFSLSAESLPKEIQTIINESKGTVGFHGINITTKKEISYNEDKFFPMASTRTIMLACHVLDHIQRGKLSLNTTINITKNDITPSSPIIKSLFQKDASDKKFTIHQLLEYMMTESDNTASDQLMKVTGGHQAMDAWLSNNKISNIIFKTDLKTWLTNHAQKTLVYKEAQQVILHSDNVPWYIRLAVNAASLLAQPATINFADEKTNIATPRAVTLFIQKLYDTSSDGYLNVEHRKILLGLMQNCKTGTQRMPKYLDKSCVIMHKTGSGIMSICNDAGIIDDVVLSIFVTDSLEPMQTLDDIVAQLAHKIYHNLKAQT